MGTEIFIESLKGVIKCGDQDVDEDVLRSWINPIYMDADTQIRVMEEFEATSEINLPGFLNAEKYEKVCELLQSDAITWSSNGPPNRRRFFTMVEETASPEIIELLSVLRSETMFLIASNLSGIKLHPMAPDTSDSEVSDEDDDEAPRIIVQKPPKVRNPRLRVEFRKWTKGCYSLVHDHDPEILDAESKLDCLLHFCHDFDTNRQHGGFVSYIAQDADEELLAVEPQSNNLSLVYRDKETARFVKYLNHSHLNTYFDISLVFNE